MAKDANPGLSVGVVMALLVLLACVVMKVSKHDAPDCPPRPRPCASPQPEPSK